MSASSSKSVRSCSTACFSLAGSYREPRRLQRTRSALGAIAAVGSIWSSVSCWTTVSRSRGRRASSSCARTAIRLACALVSSCTGARLDGLVPVVLAVGPRDRGLAPDDEVVRPVPHLDRAERLGDVNPAGVGRSEGVDHIHAGSLLG